MTSKSPRSHFKLYSRIDSSRVFINALAAVSAFAIILALTACSFGDESATATPLAPSADDILVSAAERWDATTSVAFSLVVDGATYLDDEETIELRSAEGEMEQPDRAFAVAKITLAFVSIDVSLIFMGDEAFMTDILTGSWVQAPDDFSYNPGVLMSNDEGLSEVLREFREATLVGEESLDGSSAYHVTGRVPLELIDDMTAGGLSGDLIDADIWVAVDTFEVLKIVLAEPPGEDEDSTQWTITLSGHDEPVLIERPIS